MSVDAVKVSSLKIACSTCSLRELCLPIGLPDGDLARLDAVINRRQHVKVGQHLYRARDSFHSLFAVRRGFFKTYELNKEGYEQINGFHMSGELMGFDAISTDTHVCNAVALEDSEICEIPFSKLETPQREIPTLQRQFHRILSKEIATNENLMMLLGGMSAEERLAAFLLNLSRRLERRGHSPTQLHLAMSREEIGSYLGLKLETVSRAFSKFQDQGVLGVERRNVIIKDLARLEQLAECSRA